MTSGMSFSPVSLQEYATRCIIRNIPDNEAIQQLDLPILVKREVVEYFFCHDYLHNTKYPGKTPSPAIFDRLLNGFSILPHMTLWGRHMLRNYQFELSEAITRYFNRQYQSIIYKRYYTLEGYCLKLCGHCAHTLYTIDQIEVEFTHALVHHVDLRYDLLRADNWCSRCKVFFLGRITDSNYVAWERPCSRSMFPHALINCCCTCCDDTVPVCKRRKRRIQDIL